MQVVKIDGVSFEGYEMPTETTKLLVIKSDNGFLGCGYVSIEAANKLGEHVAIVTGVKSFDDMLIASVIKVSDKAAEKGVQIGDSGRDALLKMA